MKRTKPKRISVEDHIKSKIDLLANKLIKKTASSAAIRKLEHTITVDYMKAVLFANWRNGFRCSATGVLLEDDRISIDRIDGHLGYVFYNIQVVSIDYNMSKNVMGDIDFKELCVKTTLMSIEDLYTFNQEEIKIVEEFKNLMYNKLPILCQ